MDERDFFLEARTRRPALLQCPFCRASNDYALEWMVRKKRTNLNLDRMDERDRIRFQKAASYMVLLDDMVTCAEQTCRRRFEISGVKTMAFVTEEQLEAVNFGRDGQAGDRSPRADGRRDRGQFQGGRTQPQGAARGQSGGRPQGDQGRPQQGRQQQGRPSQARPAQGGKGPAQGGKGKVRPNRDEDYGNRIDDPELPSHLTYREPGSVHPGALYGNQGQPSGPRQGARKQPFGQQRPGGQGKGGQQGAGKRKGPSDSRNQPARRDEGQPLRSPRGKRSDPTGPGGGWR
jgi:hypothetical protein